MNDEKRYEPLPGECTATDRYHDLRMRLICDATVGLKQIARILSLRSGVLQCPLCQKTVHVRFHARDGGDHFQARCESENCINCRE